MHKILVIDDDIQFNSMVCLILQDAGYEVRTAHDGAEGVKLFLQTRPDLVMTDMYMPEKEGIETIMEIRQVDKEVKILVVSGGYPHMSMTEMFTTAEMLGADAALSKPFTLNNLLEKIKDLLS